MFTYQYIAHKNKSRLDTVKFNLNIFKWWVTIEDSLNLFSNYRKSIQKFICNQTKTLLNQLKSASGIFFSR